MNQVVSRPEKPERSYHIVRDYLGTTSIYVVTGDSQYAGATGLMGA